MKLDETTPIEFLKAGRLEHAADRDRRECEHVDRGLPTHLDDPADRLRRRSRSGEIPRRRRRWIISASLSASPPSGRSDRNLPRGNYHPGLRSKAFLQSLSISLPNHPSDRVRRPRRGIGLENVFGIETPLQFALGKPRHRPWNRCGIVELRISGRQEIIAGRALCSGKA